MRCKYESWENARFVLLEDEEVCPTTAKWIANIRFDSYPRVICKKRLAEKQEV